MSDRDVLERLELWPGDQLCDDAAAEITRLRAKLAQAEDDAERRWLEWFTAISLCLSCSTQFANAVDFLRRQRAARQGGEGDGD